MNLTATEIQAIADRHLSAWLALDPRLGHPTLRDHVRRAIGEALEKQAALYAAGAETLRHERDSAIATVAWGIGTPDVPPGKIENFWCAYKDDTGKTRHVFLSYCNAHIMPLSDSCDEAPKCAVPVGDDGDYAWTGWVELSCEQCETQWTFSHEIVAWMRLPKFTT